MANTQARYDANLSQELRGLALEERLRYRITRTPTSLGIGELTALSEGCDPYRQDTPVRRRYAAWFRDQLDHALEASGRHHIHLRGLHYTIVARGDVLKPDGEVYRNNADDWKWLGDTAAKAARWLGYVPFDQIIDERNSAPEIYRQEEKVPRRVIYLNAPLLDEDFNPRIGVQDFEGRQPYHLVLFGEKSSLSEVLSPLARRFHADMYLPAGEISDTLLYQMASDGAEDGRPMKVFTIADCDPAGWQMPISIGRKLQALRDLYFGDLDFEVQPVALTPGQALELNLPSTPLKETEMRAGAWREAMGIEQTEVDALASLRPGDLRRIVTEALAPFFDSTLDRRMREAEIEWMSRTEEVLTARLADAGFDTGHALDLAEQLREEIDDLNGVLALASADIPPPEPVAAEVDTGAQPEPLVSSSWTWLRATRALIRRKGYDQD